MDNKLLEALANEFFNELNSDSEKISNIAKKCVQKYYDEHLEEDISLLTRKYLKEILGRRVEEIVMEEKNSLDENLLRNLIRSHLDAFGKEFVDRIVMQVTHKMPEIRMSTYLPESIFKDQSF
jgi:hypothetical protein